jgi:pyridoxine kinase
VTILSIQSHVAYGYVGNSAAVPVLQRLGVEVFPINTVHFSNHTGYETVRGHVLASETLTEIVRGVEERGVFADVKAVLTGYLGDGTTGRVVLDALARVRTASPQALYVCDPVMGNSKRGFYLREGVPELLRAEIVPRADILLPNAFELAFLAGREVETTADALAAAEIVHAMGPKVVVGTSLPGPRESELSVLALSAEGAWQVITPRLEVLAEGAGDCFAAMFLAHYLASGAVEVALVRAVNGIYGVLEATRKQGRLELALLAPPQADGGFQAVRLK